LGTLESAAAVRPIKMINLQSGSVLTDPNKQTNKQNKTKQTKQNKTKQNKTNKHIRGDYNLLSIIHNDLNVLLFFEM
jgi:hypothetical protein